MHAVVGIPVVDIYLKLKRSFGIEATNRENRFCQDSITMYTEEKTIRPFSFQLAVQRSTLF